jgi:putative membrane protein
MTTTSQLLRIGLKQNLLLKIVLPLFTVVWLSTLIGTTNFTNWMMENTLVVIFLSVLVYSYRYFKFSDLSYAFIFVYLCLHIYGAKHTYALNPFGFWLKDILHLERNPYDRIVHFSFGFMLAYPMRDFFFNKMQFPNWVCWILPVEITLSFSCLYELIEWAVADVFFPEQGADYLGSQGDIWDAQKDMFLAFVGSMLILVLTYIMKRILKK